MLCKLLRSALVHDDLWLHALYACDQDLAPCNACDVAVRTILAIHDCTVLRVHTIQVCTLGVVLSCDMTNLEQ